MTTSRAEPLNTAVVHVLLTPSTVMINDTGRKDLVQVTLLKTFLSKGWVNPASGSDYHKILTTSYRRLVCTG